MNLKDKKPLIAVVGVAFVALAAWLAFGFFGIQSAFIDNEVSESADDLFTASSDVEETDVSSEPESPVEEEPVEEPGEDELAEDEPVEDEPVEEAPVEEPVEDEVVEDEPVEEAPAEIVTIASGDFQSLSSYSVEGQALVLNNGTEQRFLRFENFVSDNGPDLKVYLRAANGEFVNLGDLSGNIGDQNYEIPVEVDLDIFTNVEIWCERFSVGFGVTTLAPV